MKGKKEGGEKKGKEGRKKEEGKKEKEREKKKQSSTAGLEPVTFHSRANCLWLPPGGRIAHTYYTDMYISQISILMT